MVDRDAAPAGSGLSGRTWPGKEGLFLLLLAGLSQGLLAAFHSFGSSFPWVVWSVPPVACALLLGRARLSSPHPPASSSPLLAVWLLVPALWILATLPLAESFGLALGIAWTWAVALLWGGVFLVVDCRRTRYLLLLLLLWVPGLYALQRGALLQTLPLHLQGAEADENVLALRIVLMAVSAPHAMHLLAGERATGALLTTVTALFGAFCAWVVLEGLSSRAGVMLLLMGSALGLLALRRSAAALVLGIAGGLLLAVLADPGGSVTGQFRAEAFARQSGTRGSLISAAWELVRAAPLLGHGLGAFSLLYPPLRSPLDGTEGRLVHNDYLQLWAEGGVILPLWLLIAGAAACWGLVRLVRCLHQSSPREDAGEHIRMGFLALLCAGMILGHALINFPLYDPPTLVNLVVALVLGLGVAFGSRSPAGWKSRLVDPVSGRLRYLRSFLVIIAVLAWLHAVVWSSGMVVLAKLRPLPFMQPLQVSSETQYALAEKLHAWHLAGGMPAALLATFAATAWRIDPETAPASVVPIALAYYDEAVRRSPYLPEHRMQKARLMREAGVGSRQERIDLLESVLEKDPYHAPAWWALAFELQEAGIWVERAEAHARRWIPRCRRMAATHLREAIGFARLLPEAVRREHADELEQCGLAEVVLRNRER